MNNTVTVRVTEEHILKGIKRNAGKCPIKLALIDAGLEDVKFCCASPTHNSGFPREVADFISDFDSDLPVAPFSFEYTYDCGSEVTI